MKIEQKDLDNFWKYHKLADACQDKIYKRIDHVLRNVFPKIFDGFVLGWWDYATYNFESEEDGSLSYAWNVDSINLRAQWRESPYEYEDWLRDYVYEFPVKFLTCSDEDIEKEIKDGLALEEAIEQLKEKMEKAAEQEKKVFKQAALNKLTEEERKILGLK